MLPLRLKSSDVELDLAMCEPLAVRYGEDGTDILMNQLLRGCYFLVQYGENITGVLVWAAVSRCSRAV